MKPILRIVEESWAMREPFEIAGQVMASVPLLRLEIAAPDGYTGRAEAAGIDYDGETPATMRAQLEAVADRLTASTTPAAVASWLPRGGARNALDCALWDLLAKRSGRPAWEIAGVPEPRPLVTACTIGLGDLDDVRRRARALGDAPFIKVKVDGTRHVECLRAVRQEAAGARLAIDANQSWSRALLERLLPDLLALDVAFVEQPVPRGEDDQLDGWPGVIPLVADESCTDRASIARLKGRYQGINIKLDKTGGLTEALALARVAQEHGLDVMVGNMCGTSLGMAPAFLVAQLARWVDLDGPLLQQEDREHAMTYREGKVHPPAPQLWG